MGCLGRDVDMHVEFFSCILRELLNFGCGIVFQMEGEKDKLASDVESRQLW